MRIKEKDVLKIFEHGKSEAPLEACGYLAGKENVVFSVFHMVNMDKSREHFSFDPKEQFSIMRLARAEGWDIIGVYHTHPKSPARPSKEDIRLAYDTDKIYVIASLSASTLEIKAYKIQNGDVKEEVLVIEQ